MMTLAIDDRRLELIQGDITTLAVDAFVNATEALLTDSGGFDGAVYQRGGPALIQECRQIRAYWYPNGLPVGEAVITSGGLLPARYIIHTVGPIWRGGLRDEDRMLRTAYENSLSLARDHGLESIAFPSISTGPFGFPEDHAALIALSTIIAHLSSESLPSRVTMVLFYPHDLRVYCRILRRLLPSLKLPKVVLDTAE